jgi:hypothetical protein
MPIYTPGKLVLKKEFGVQGYMYEFPSQYPLWTPANITTALWLDAADAATVTTVSGAVSQWNDKSGNTRHATQATSAQRPVYTSAALSGQNVVEFNPISSNHQRLSFSRLASIGHVFFVAKKNNVDNSSVVLTDGSADDLRGVSFGAGAGSNFVVQQIAGSLSTATRNNWHIAEIKTDGTNASLGINATRTTSADTDVMSCSDIGWYRNVGDPSVVPIASFRGQVAEIIMSVSPLDDGTRQRIEGYLAHKWGLTANLPVGHPYKTVGPTP